MTYCQGQSRSRRLLLRQAKPETARPRSSSLFVLTIVRILALETSSRNSRIALLDGSALLREVELDRTQRTTQTLVPGIQQLMQDIGWTPRQLQLVAVTIGPGSFTGLRIGVTTAKTLAYAVGADVIGVNTLTAIAEQTDRRPVWAVVDAQRKQLFAALFAGREDAAAHERTQIVDNGAWLDGLTASVSVTGPGLAKLVDLIPTGTPVVDQQLWHPQAATIGRLGWSYYQAGRRDDLWRLLPAYGRQSAAEEKKQRGSG